MRSRPLLAVSAALAIAAGSLFIASPAIADTATTSDGDYTYSIANGEASISAFTPAMGVTTITIPASLGSMPVTDIGAQAFAAKGLTAVTIPDSVTTLGYGAFQYNSITSVDFGTGITSMSIYAFAHNLLTSISLPAGVTSFGNAAFLDNQLTTASIPASVTTIDNAIFAGNAMASVMFEGDAPVNFLTANPFQGSLIDGTDPAALARLTVYYLASSSGFTPGTWNGYNSVALSAPAITTTTLAAGTVGSAYSAQLSATGGAITFASVSLPANGLTITSSGEISGTPLTSGSSTIVITAANSIGPDDSETFTLAISPAPVAPTITSSALPGGTVGTAYDFTPTSTGSMTNVLFSLTNGTTLPDGLALDPATGRIHGTPTTEGSTPIELRLANVAGSDDLSSTIVIAAAPVIPTTVNFIPGFVVGTRVADATVAVAASGLLVGSTYTLTLHSDPVILGQGIITSTGELNLVEQIPVGTPAGSHSLVLNITAADGTAISRTIWFSILSDGTIGAISTIGPIPPSLAATGFDATTPIGIGAVLLFVGALMVVRRRRLR
ncbi:hypothetical protein BH09ACT1_BH09ACT1_21680 [soil metagenome]